MQLTTSGAVNNGQFITIRYTRGAAGIGLGATPKFLCRRHKPAVEICVGNTEKLRPQASVLAPRTQRTTSGAAGNGLHTTTKRMRGPVGIGLGTTIKYLRRAASAAANNGLGNTTKDLVN
jgi:hypothetical protein